MKRILLLSITVILLIPIFLFAVDIPSISIGGGKEQAFGGKVGDKKGCNCPTEEPQKLGWERLEYEIFWKGNKKTTQSLFYKPTETKLYKHGKLDKGIWHLGKYKEESASCKYITPADYAEAAVKALAGAPAPPKCSGELKADGTVIYMGTSKKASGGGISLPNLPL